MMGCYWAEEYGTLQLRCSSFADVNKFLLAYHIILFKRVYFQQYLSASAKEYLTAAMYYCQVEVKFCFMIR